jgi:predicted O-methyltransferase YrrM
VVRIVISEEDVRAAYRLLLGREAENEEVVAFHAADHSSREELWQTFINSPEFQSRVTGQPVTPVSRPPALPAVSMHQVCRFGMPIRILEPEAADGNVSLLELIVLNHFVAARAPNVIFELGTFDGRTTINLAANAPDEAIIYTIDLPQSRLDQAQFELDPEDHKYISKEKSGVRFIDTAEATKIIQLIGDTANFDFSKWYGRVDFVFVDASHSAPYVRNDTEVACKLVGGRPGLIVWHDYNGWPGVTEVLEEYQRSDPRFRNMAYVSGTSVAFCEMSG